jgi:hypothetical protein
MIRSPKTGKISLSRAAGALCILSANIVALAGIALDREHAGVVMALAGVAGVALIVRDRRDPYAASMYSQDGAGE